MKKIDVKRFDKIAMLDRLLFVPNNNCYIIFEIKVAKIQKLLCHFTVF